MHMNTIVKDTLIVGIDKAFSNARQSIQTFRDAADLYGKIGVGYKPYGEAGLELLTKYEQQLKDIETKVKELICG